MMTHSGGQGPETQAWKRGRKEVGKELKVGSKKRKKVKKEGTKYRSNKQMNKNH